MYIMYVMRTTNRIMRTTDRENVKLSLSLERQISRHQMMPNKGWEINEEDNDKMQLTKIIMNKKRAEVWFHVHSFI